MAVATGPEAGSRVAEKAPGAARRRAGCAGASFVAWCPYPHHEADTLRSVLPITSLYDTRQTFRFALQSMPYGGGYSAPQPLPLGHIPGESIAVIAPPPAICDYPPQVNTAPSVRRY
jgi:hypothetical protein